MHHRHNVEHNAHQWQSKTKKDDIMQGYHLLCVSHERLYKVGVSQPQAAQNSKECVRQCVDGPGRYYTVPKYAQENRLMQDMTKSLKPTTSVPRTGCTLYQQIISHRTQIPQSDSQVSSLLNERVSEFTYEPVPLFGFPRRDRNTDQDLADIWNQGMSDHAERIAE